MKKLIILAIFLTACVGIPSAEAEITMFHWQPPTARIDGSPITGPISYQIYCGSESGVYAPPVDVGGVLEYSIDTMLAGYANGWAYCAFTAYYPEPSGAAYTITSESPYSNEVMVYKPGAKYYLGTEYNKGVFGVK